MITAQMATFDISHPDVEEFIVAKRKNGRFRQFNLSLLITDEFMQAVEADSDWPLMFPISEKEQLEDKLDLQDPSQVRWKRWPITDEYIVDPKTGFVACRIIKAIRAKDLWDLVMINTYNYAEPGFILIDEVNRKNNNWFCENIRTSNPCGELLASLA